MKTQTKLGELIGTPPKRAQVVKYKGRQYYASEEDIRHIMEMVIDYFHDRIMSGEITLNSDVTQLVKNEMSIEIYLTYISEGKFTYNRRLVKVYADGRIGENVYSADFLKLGGLINTSILQKRRELENFYINKNLQL